jgi:hypothetical protein
MKIPQKITVGHIIYTVQYMESLNHMDENLSLEGEILGACDYDTATITLKTELSKERMEQVFCHELAHAIFYEAGYDDHDEDMINRLGIVLHGMFVSGGLEIFCMTPQEVSSDSPPFVPEFEMPKKVYLSNDGNEYG